MLGKEGRRAVGGCRVGCVRAQPAHVCSAALLPVVQLRGVSVEERRVVLRAEAAALRRDDASEGRAERGTLSGETTTAYPHDGISEPLRVPTRKQWRVGTAEEEAAQHLSLREDGCAAGRQGVHTERVEGRARSLCVQSAEGCQAEGCPLLCTESPIAEAADGAPPPQRSGWVGQRCTPCVCVCVVGKKQILYCRLRYVAVAEGERDGGSERGGHRCCSVLAGGISMVGEGLEWGVEGFSRRAKGFLVGMRTRRRRRWRITVTPWALCGGGERSEGSVTDAIWCSCCVPLMLWRGAASLP